MGWLTRLRTRRARTDDAQQRAFDGGSAIPGPAEGVSAAGVVVTDDTAMRLGAVWDCVSLITDVVAALPLEAFRRSGSRRVLLDPTPPLVAQLHPELDNVDWMTQTLVSLLQRGNSYALVVTRDRLQRPTSLLPLHPDQVMPTRVTADGASLPASAAPQYRYQAGELRYDIAGLGSRPRADVLHIRGLTLPGADLGMSPIEYHRLTIGLGLAAAEFGTNFFRDGANPSGVLKTADPNLKPDQARKLRAMWEQQHGGRGRGTAVLGGGMDWSPVSITPDEAQFLETRRYNRAEIAGMYRIPPHLIGETDRSTTWGSGLEQQNTGFVQYTLTSWMTRVERGITGLLARPQYVRLNADALLRGDVRARGEAYAKGRQWGWLSANDIRDREDLPPIQGGDEYLVPQNMRPAADPPPADPTPIVPSEEDPQGA